MTRPILFRVVAIGLGIALCGVGFEAALRVNNLRRPTAVVADTYKAKPPRPAGVSGETEPTPWFSRYDGRAVSQRAQMLPFADVNCDNQRGPGAKPACEVARHNSSGFRVPEFTIAHPPDTFRIVIVGDSFTWGDGSELEDTFHRQLQRRYDRAQTASRPKVEIVALAVNGSSFTDNITRLLTYGARLQPDLVLVQFVNNDLQQRVAADLRGAGRADSLLDTSAAGRFVRDLIARFQRGSSWEAEMERVYDAASPEWKLFTSGLSVVDRWRSGGVPVAFLSFAEVPMREERTYEYFQDPPAISRFRVRAEAEFERMRFPLLRTADIFRERAANRFLAASATNGHYGPFANELTADAIAEFLDHARWIDFDKPRPRDVDERWAAERALRDDAAARWDEYRESADLQRKLFTRLLELYPGDPFLTQDLARVYRATGDFEMCRATYLALGKVAPAFSAPGYHLSFCAHDPAEQVAFLTQTLEVVPDHAGAAERLADLEAKAGRLERACGCYSRLSEVATYNDQANNAKEAARRYDCARIVQQSCPGRDPFDMGEQ